MKKRTRMAYEEYECRDIVHCAVPILDKVRGELKHVAYNCEGDLCQSECTRYKAEAHTEDDWIPKVRQSA
jgi:hypothetical protein